MDRIPRGRPAGVRAQGGGAACRCRKRAGGGGLASTRSTTQQGGPWAGSFEVAPDGACSSGCSRSQVWRWSPASRSSRRRNRRRLSCRRSAFRTEGAIRALWPRLHPRNRVVRRSVCPARSRSRKRRRNWPTPVPHPRPLASRSVSPARRIRNSLRRGLRRLVVCRSCPACRATVVPGCRTRAGARTSVPRGRTNSLRRRPQRSRGGASRSVGSGSSSVRRFPASSARWWIQSRPSRATTRTKGAPVSTLTGAPSRSVHPVDRARERRSADRSRKAGACDGDDKKRSRGR